ncbi:MAG: recombinase family protein [Phycisphaerae bacterium]
MKRTQAKSSESPPRKRCAIYVRKSHEEGLAQAFNSLDAQLAAAQAYIASQASQGWVALPDVYSDGGYSGANTDRPGMKRLLADVSADKIDIILVNKIDRLSRSLLDFADLIKLFDQHGVAIVSVTQSFDTATPMGRLTLHMLLSFAQYEREVISERIRDKLALTRQRGGWTGGTPALGFDVDRSGASPRLVVNPVEASRTLQIFQLYTELKSLLAVVEELERRGWRCKTWQTRDGRQRGGQPFDKTRLHALLTNPIVIGKIKHHGAVYDGQHEAIVLPGLFDRVQRLLKSNGRGGPEQRNKHGALLRGLLRCKHCDRAMYHTFTGCGAKRYRYYQCTTACKRGRSACPTRSVPASEIERIVVDEVRAIGRDPGLIKATVGECKRQREEQLERLGGERRTVERGVTRLRAELAGSDVDPARIVEVSRQIDTATQRLADIDAAVARLRADTLNTRDVSAALADFDQVWTALQPKEQARIVQLVVRRVSYDGPSKQVAIEFSDTGIATLAAEVTPTQEDAA